MRRYKRFLADVELATGEVVVAHARSPGRMTGCQDPGSRVWLSYNEDPKRKLRWTWEIASDGDVLVGVDPMLSNRLVAELIEGGYVAELGGYHTLAREVPCGERSRMDLKLSAHAAGAPDCWVEVKTATLGRAGLALFPDAPTERGRRHLATLTERVRAGERAVMFYVCQRGDARAFAPAEDVDPAYAQALREAVVVGVEVLAWRAEITPALLHMVEPIPTYPGGAS